jgi:hypothetical protein
MQIAITESNIIFLNMKGTEKIVYLLIYLPN